ncbi:hypothetical protein, secreted [gut metagenome]|uniref:Uncharacterized protein n=1 Tax=gut metagenome TaxID=749906 RepID=J9GMR4_9ZZZZ
MLNLKIPKRLALLATLFCSLFQFSHAQKLELVGEVEDAFLKTPIDSVNYYILNEDKSQVLDTAHVLRFVDTSGELIKIMYVSKVEAERRSYWIHAEREGYGSVWKTIEIKDPKATQIDLPFIQMKRTFERKLNEAVVTATKIKMYYKGDTLVYNADAFKLPDGSMLDALIKQMPGVTMTENGEIFVNGRKVDELLLASRSFMNGNKKVLMENLPYFTVKDIKVYEKQSDRSKALGYDVDPRSYVMDVNLKNKYTQGYIANIEAAGGTQERWMGRGFLLGFTDRWRYSVMANSNNVNESRHIGERGHWTPMLNPTSLVTTHSVATDLDYQSKDKNVKNNVNASYTSTDTEQEVRQRREQFLEGSRPISQSSLHSDAENWNVKAVNDFSYSKGFYFTSFTDFNYGRRNAWSNGFLEESDRGKPTVNQRTHGLSGGYNWGLTQRFGGSFNLNKEKQESISYMLLFMHFDEQLWNADRFELKRLATPATTLQHNTADISNRSNYYFCSLSYQSKDLGKGIHFNVHNQLTYSLIHNRDFLYHPDSLMSPSQLDMLTAITDPNNSYVSNVNNVFNLLKVGLRQVAHYKLSPSLPINIAYDRWTLGAEIFYQHRSLDYMRGAIDTVVRDNRVPIAPYASFRQVFKNGKHDIQMNVKYNKEVFNLLDKIAIRDDRNPLVVKLNNPELKEKTSTHFDMSYKNKNGKHMQNWSLSASLDYHHRDIVQSVNYNQATGVYTYRPVNVNGSYFATARFDISRSFDKNNHWTWQMNTQGNYHHSIDHAMLAGETASHRNVVNTTIVRSDTYIQYNKDQLNVRLTGDVSWRNTEGKMRDFSTLKAWDYKYGFNARYTLPVIRTTIAADGMMYSRRGYGSSDFNSDDFVVNASISQSLLKGRLIAKIEAFDLFHELSSVQYNVDAQGRTETWSRSLPHYVMFHLAYYFNKKPGR